MKPRKPRPNSTDPLGGIGATTAFVVFAALVAVAFCIYAAPYTP